MKLDKLDNISVPKELENIKENIYSKKVKRQKFKYVAAACLCLFLFGFTIPGYTKDLPVYSQIFNFFGMDNYQNTSTVVNQEVTDNGVTIKLVDAVYSGKEVTVTFEIKSDKLNGEGLIDTDFDLKFKNAKKEGMGGGFATEYMGDNTYVGYLNMNVDFIEEPPKELIAKLKFKDIDILKGESYNEKDKIKGKWNFEFPINQLENKKFTNDFIAKKDGYFVKIDEILKDESGVTFTLNYWSDYDFPVYMYSDYYCYIVQGEDEIEGLDDKGKPINDVKYSNLHGGSGNATSDYGDVIYKNKPMGSGDYKMYIEMRKSESYYDRYKKEIAEKRIIQENFDVEAFEKAPEKILLEIPFTIK